MPKKTISNHTNTSIHVFWANFPRYQYFNKYRLFDLTDTYTNTDYTHHDHTDTEYMVILYTFIIIQILKHIIEEQV